MSKKKKQSLDLKSQLHAISPLPLDIVIERLDHLRREDVNLQVEIINDNIVNFRLSQRRSSLSIAEVYGTLRRWQGTETRADVNSKATVLREWLDWLLQFAVFISLIIGYLVGIALIGVFFSLFVGSLGLLWFLILPAAVAAAYITESKGSASNFFDKQRYHALRDVDALMQNIADILTDEDEDELIELDGTDDALSRLLAQQDEGAKAQMGTDGELS